MSNWQLTTPVAFLVFNRPDTTARVFEAIRAARPPRLLVVADGPRHDRPDDAALCAAARAIIEGVDWPCEVLRNYADANMGCKARVSSGLNWVFSQVEEAIILEDDCLPHLSFFSFCQEILARYREDERVMMVGGTNFLIETPGLVESYFFSRFFPIWGWATWRRSWLMFDLEMSEWPRLRSELQLQACYSQRFLWHQFKAMFDRAYQNRINTWDIQWTYSCLFNNGLSVVPGANLISNIGLVGTHTSGDLAFNQMPVYSVDTENLRHPLMVHPDHRFDDAMFRILLKPTVASMVRKVYFALHKRLRKMWGGPRL